MLKKNIFIAFVLMLISIFLLTSIPTYESAEEPYETNYTPKKTTKKRTTKKHKANSSSQKKSLGYPKWIGWRWKSKIINDDGQKKFKIDITYTNKSKDKIIKCIFNKSITFSFKQCTEVYAGGDITYKGKHYSTLSNCHASSTFPKPNYCEIYPGDSYTLTYYMPLSRFNWKQKYSKNHKLMNYKLSHSFQVQKENMNDVE